MPRSPYQGTFTPNVRPTVVTAPDALVYINGETDIQGCPTCKKRFDINRYVTSIQVDLSVEGAPGSASLTMSFPRHSIDDFYFEGNPLICPMMEIEIFAKGYYLVEGVPQYYPIFWGIVTEVGDAYGSGEQSISIHCADILKWWELCKMNINPAFVGAQANQMGRSIFGNVFFGKNPYDVIWTLAQNSFGDVVIGSGSLISLLKEAGGQKPVFDSTLQEMALYWNDRFSRMRSNLLLYGTNGVAVRGDSLEETWKLSRTRVKAGQPFASNAVFHANGGKQGGQMVFDPASPNVVAFRTQFNQAGQVNFWTSEYQTKLELANAAKESIGFEFFMDVTGDIVFKPPFYNLDILSNKPISWIQDIDVIDYDLSESEAEVVTQLTLQGSFGGTVDYGMPAEVTPFTSVTDYHLLRKYGWRSQTHSSEFMGSPDLMFYHGLDILDRMNSKRHRGTVNIPCRPELRLGFPVYLAFKDQVWYVAGISHNIQMGGRATTTLTLTARRQKFIACKGIGQLDHTGFKKGGPKGANGAKKNDPNIPGPNPGANTGGNAFPFSGRDLSSGATFSLKIGDAGTMPPSTDAIQAATTSGNNPYEPLILRHPKTGRIVGYPNVVMCYTRPFAPPSSDYKKYVGESGKPYKSNKTNPNKQMSANQQALEEGAVTANDKDRIRALHLTNRYQYGLNSAGAFVYAYESKKVVGEMCLIPSANLTTTPASVNVQVQTIDPKTKKVTTTSKEVKPFPGGSSMIRPVSDERGFEVIGHFRYGRGVALRDGSLILTGGLNDAVNVNLQLSLSGDLFATLNAQSAGLTTITSTYQNPMDALARLQPEDLQTAGVLTPGTDQPSFQNTGTNFVDSAPIGSEAEKGVKSSVEASQLSRALTLAEMSVRDSLGSDTTADDCSCTTGRADLAFIANGYQVKVLMGTVPDGSTLFDNSTVALNATAGGNAALAQGGPVVGSLLSPSFGDELNMVDKFLNSLYLALDEPHQDFEAQIRGDIQFGDIGGPNGNAALAAFGGTFSPPFGAANRANFGSAAGAALAASSAIDNIKTTWKKFGDDLKNKPLQTELVGRIQADEKKIAALQQEILAIQNPTGLNAALDQKPIATIQKEIANLQTEVASLRGELGRIGGPP